MYPAVLALTLVGLFPVGEWLILPLENRFPAPAEPPDEVDGVIVLGGAVDLAVAEGRGVEASHGNAERDIAMVELASAIRMPSWSTPAAASGSRSYGGMASRGG